MVPLRLDYVSSRDTNNTAACEMTRVKDTGAHTHTLTQTILKHTNLFMYVCRRMHAHMPV